MIYQDGDQYFAGPSMSAATTKVTPYIQRLPTVQAYYNEGTKTYHVKCEGGESNVPKDIFESNKSQVG